jgi:hypothetical protein
MKTTEAAALLTICAAYDNRKPDADQAKAWAMALDGLRFEDCREAIVQHYRASREWIMPADVVSAVKKTRTSRLEDVAPSPPPGLDPDDTGAYAHWLAVVRQAIADGREVPAEDYAATRHVGELRHVLRPVPAIEAKPREKSAEHDDRKAAAEAELRARPAVPVADPLEDDAEDEPA